MANVFNVIFIKRYIVEYNRLSPTIENKIQYICDFKCQFMKTIRTCLECGERLYGRSDKKFCNDHCRNSFNHKVSQQDGTFLRKINSLLKRNRKILSEITAHQSTVCIHKSRLAERGFVADFHTHISTLEDGSVCYHYYEFGISQVDQNLFLISSNNEYSSDGHN